VCCSAWPRVAVFCSELQYVAVCGCLLLSKKHYSLSDSGSISLLVHAYGLIFDQKYSNGYVCEDTHVHLHARSPGISRGSTNKKFKNLQSFGRFLHHRVGRASVRGCSPQLPRVAGGELSSKQIQKDRKILYLVIFKLGDVFSKDSGHVFSKDLP